MATFADPSKNKVCVDWLGKKEICTKYFKKIKGKKFGFIGTEETKKDAEKLVKQREKLFDKKNKFFKLGEEYLIYQEK